MSISKTLLGTHTPSLIFHGAAQTVTGSMHLLHLKDKLIAMDCGLFQGRRHEGLGHNKKFPVAPNKIDTLLLSHAHIDHSGNIPNLVKRGFDGTVFATSATSDLCEVMLADSGHIQEEDAAFWNKKRAKTKSKNRSKVRKMRKKRKYKKRASRRPQPKIVRIITNVRTEFRG